MRTPNNERLTPDIADAPTARTGSAPERRCILSGEHAPRGELVRLAISPDGLVLPDPQAKAPGRGAWVGVRRAELQDALDSGRLKSALGRAFKGAPLTIAPDLPERIERALARALLDRLGLELRAGFVLLGSDRIAQAARMGTVALLLHAADASEDGTKKLDQAWRVGRAAEGSGARGMRLPLDRAALSVALGRDNVVHLALTERSSADRVTRTLVRLLQYQGEGPEPNDGARTSARAG